KLNPTLASSLPHMNTKDVEDVIKSVYDNRSEEGRVPAMAQLQQVIGHPQGPQQQQQPPHQQQQKAFPPGLAQPENVLPQAQWSPTIPSSSTPPSAVSPASSQSSSSSSGRANNILKWESDEALGEMSTISPVLYANVNCPHLKQEFPHWPDRVKQITKIWRN